LKSDFSKGLSVLTFCGLSGSGASLDADVRTFSVQKNLKFILCLYGQGGLSQCGHRRG